MAKKIRLFAEVDNYLIPIDFDENMLKALNIRSLNEVCNNNHGSHSETNNTIQHIIPYSMLKKSDVIDYITAHINESHSNQSVAQYFGIDIGKGHFKNKAPDQNHAYDKIHRFTKNARKDIEKTMNGIFVKGQKGVKNQIAVWRFKRNETGSQTTQ